MENKFYSKVFLWLFVGLLATFASGYGLLYVPQLLKLLFTDTGYIILFILQIVLCILLAARIHKMNPITAKIVYILYALLTGVTFSTIFLIFDLTSILLVFLVTSILFGVFAFIGKVTDIDLTKWGVYLFIGLLAIIIIEVINIFLMNNTIDILATMVSAVIFLGYIAYDIRRISVMSEYANDNLAILAAFELYLDFINLFIDLMRLFGKESD